MLDISFQGEKRIVKKRKIDVSLLKVGFSKFIEPPLIGAANNRTLFIKLITSSPPAPVRLARFVIDGIFGFFSATSKIEFRFSLVCDLT